MSRAIRADLRIPFSASWLRTRRSAIRLDRSTAEIARNSGAPSLGRAVVGFSTKASARQSQPATASVRDSREGTMAGSPEKATAPEGQLAIVFTDIVKSTYLWDHNPVAMKEAMEKHDGMVRALNLRHHGYEVKQNGDGFMIAFQTAVSALEFCLDVQQQLLDIEWPKDLLEIGAGSEVRSDDDSGVGDDAVLFRGLRLRMSCHWGEPVAQWNEVISRMDYMGPMVNRAARFIQATEGGQIVVSEPFLQALAKANGGASKDREIDDGPLFAVKEGEGDRSDDELGQKIDLSNLRMEQTESILKDRQFEVRLLGQRHFKGVSDMQKLFFIIPESLRGRLQFWPKHLGIEGSKGNLVEPD